MLLISGLVYMHPTPGVIQCFTIFVKTNNDTSNGFQSVFNHVTLLIFIVQDKHIVWELIGLLYAPAMNIFYIYWQFSLVEFV